MAENTNNSVNQNEGKQKEERKPYVVTFKEHEPFDSISESKMVTSTDLCKTVSRVFSQVFADFEGSRIDIDSSTSRATISLIFNHIEGSNSGLPFACTKDINTGTQNETISRLRRYSYRLDHGDQYQITEDGKDVIERLLSNNPRIYTRDGKVKWNEVVVNIANTNQMIQNQQYTAVMFVDIDKLCKFIYGAKNEYDENWIYVSNILRSAPGGINMANGVAAREYAFEIKRIKEEQVIEQGRRMGFAYQMNGLDIVRALDK